MRVRISRMNTSNKQLILFKSGWQALARTFFGSSSVRVALASNQLLHDEPLRMCQNSGKQDIAQSKAK